MNEFLFINVVNTFVMESIGKFSYPFIADPFGSNNYGTASV